MVRTDLSQRTLLPEVMDQPGLDAKRHGDALNGLARINYWSCSAGSLWPSIREAASEVDRTLRVLDVACGGGDVVVRLFHKARAANLSLEFLGVDMSPVAVRHAAKRAEASNADVRFQQLDVLTDPIPGGYDVITSSLFLHHLEEGAAIGLLQRMARAAARLLLINDLRRDWLGYWLAQTACRVLSTSPIVHTDGPRSVAGAFTVDEVARLFEQAGLRDVEIVRAWPRRMLATWRRH